MPRLIVAGAGLAGLRSAQSARRAGWEGEIALIGDEPHAPYTRPPLSKELLRGESSPRDAAFPGLDALDADLRLGDAVARVDAAAHAVTLAGGETLGYDRLILATGSRARLPPALAGARELHVLRGLDDAARLRAALSGGGTLAVLGAGFVGCEVAASLASGGAEVALIDRASQPLAPIGPELGGRVAQLHAEHGVQLHLGAEVEEIEPDAIRLTDGTRVPADIMLVAVGAEPCTAFLSGSGIALDASGGVLCDATLTSVSQPDVLAAGDVVAWPHAGAGGERVRVEHWTTAAEHGRVAGANAVREPAAREAHTAPPYVWSDQYELKIQLVGFPARAARIEIVEEDPDPGARRLLAEARDADGELIGAVAFNHARRLAEYRRRLVADHA